MQTTAPTPFGQPRRPYDRLIHPDAEHARERRKVEAARIMDKIRDRRSRRREIEHGENAQ